MACGGRDSGQQTNGRGSLACGGRDSGRLKSFRGGLDDPSLATKQNRHRHMNDLHSLGFLGDGFLAPHALTCGRLTLRKSAAIGSRKPLRIGSPREGTLI